MRYPKGKSPDTAPLGVFCLTAFEIEGDVYYAVAKRVQGAWHGEVPSFKWVKADGVETEVTRWWPLPGRHGRPQ
jgi:hypothetical protein